MGKIEALRRVVSEAVAAQGLELVDVETGPGLVRVLLDRPGGIDLDSLSDANRAISAALDAHEDVVPRGSYGLEVSSPGVERPLREPEHFRRFVGSEVSVRTRPGVEGERRVRGRIAAVEDGAVLLDLGSGLRRIALADIERARTVFDWTGGGASKGRKRTKGAAKADESERAARA